MALMLFQQRRPAEALSHSSRAVAIRSDVAAAHAGRGDAFAALGRSEEALAQYDRALQLAPDLSWAHLNRGNALAGLGRTSDALAGFQCALLLNPGDADALLNLGNVLSRLDRQYEGLVCFDRALHVKPDLLEAHFNRGMVQARKHPEAALASCERLLQARPDLPEAHMSRGNLLNFLSRPLEALASCESALQLKPELVEAHMHRTRALLLLARIEEAIASSGRALSLAPDLDEAITQATHLRLLACDWKAYERDRARLSRMVAEGRRVNPFLFRTADASPAEQLKCAVTARREYQAGPSWAPRAIPLPKDRRIRVAYLSSDFSEHPISYLLAEVIEAHERSQFEIAGYCIGHHRESPTRRRMKAAFDRFVELHSMSDVAAAQRIRDDGVEILVDLNGYTGFARADILAHRPAPIQASYLGYVGTSGGELVDFVISDEFSVSPAQRGHYAETVISLPGSYLPIPERRPVARALSRRDYGLPERGIVLCCFNSSYKITPPVFGVWMALLGEVPGSVLWLYSDSQLVKTNLRKEAWERGIDPSRIVFAAKLPIPEYLARFQAADLFLDTHPCSACTVASDALFAGLPIVTLAGGTFASRHAGSLLTALGFPELIAHTLDGYGALAKALASRPDLIGDLKARLQARLRSSATTRARDHAAGLEAAYRRMIAERLASPSRDPALGDRPQ